MVKYAALICNRRLDASTYLDVDRNTYITNFSKIFFKSDEVAHWEKWNGSIKWENLLKSGCVLSTWMETEKPEVLDAENIELSKRMEAAWYGLLLCEGTWPFYGDSYALTGKADLSEGKVVMANIQQFSCREQVVRPFYEHCTMEYIESFRQKDNGVYLDAWKANYLLLEHGYRAAGKVTSIIEDALESFKDAKTHRNVATAIARYVEAAEAVIAMPRGNSGRREFARRAFEILKPSVKDPYLQWEVQEISDHRLLQLYDLRNARNHGKGMRDSVVEVLDLTDAAEIDSTIGKLAYLAEDLAKKSILKLLNHPRAATLILARANLEQAWETNSFI